MLDRNTKLLLLKYLSRRRRGHRDPGAARPLDPRRTAGSRTVGVVIQHGCAHPRGPRPLLQGDPLRDTRARAPHREGPEGTPLSTLARDGWPARGIAAPSAPLAPGAPLCQPL